MSAAMYKPYMQPVTKAAPDIIVPDSHVAPWMRLLFRLIGRLYLRGFIGGAAIGLRHESHLIESFRRALKHESRCIAAFLHPNGAEPHILGWFTLFRLKKFARKAGVVYTVQPHLRFVYAYEVLRWGGALARFILPRMGAMPVYHAKLDSHSMESIYKALIDGPYPVALAPEGQVSYFSDRIPHLEQGATRIGFTAAERLEKSGTPVEILPVSVQYYFDSRGKKAMEKLLRKIERYLGGCEKEGELVTRLLLCRERILEKNEERYGIQADQKADTFAERVDALIETCIARTEKILDVTRHGAVFSRMYYLRQICWDRIFIAGKASLDGMARLDRSIADLTAGEAWYASRHLELVDFVWYLRNAPVPTASSPLYQQVEYVQNLWDFANRTMGGIFKTRKLIHPYKVSINAAPPINLTGYLTDYRTNRKETVQKVMDELEKRFLDIAGDREKEN